MQGRFVVGRAVAHRFRQRIYRVTAVVRGGDHPWRMGRAQRQMGEPTWTRALLRSVDPIHCALREKVGVGMCRGINGGPRYARCIVLSHAHAVGRAMIVRHAVAERLQPVSPRPAVGCHVNDRCNTWQQAFIRGQARIIIRQIARIGGGVGIAEQCRIVARPARLNGPVGEPCIQRRAIGAGAVIVQIHAGVQTRAGWSAGHGVGVMAREQRSRRGQRIERRCAHHRMIERGQTIAAPLVGSDQQHIAPLC